MADYIDRQAAIDATWFEPSYTDPLNVLTEVRDKIKVLPSADVAPVRHGHWIHYGFDTPHGVDWMHCSECGKRDKFCQAALTNYCPNCGARMQKGEET